MNTQYSAVELRSQQCKGRQARVIWATGKQGGWNYQGNEGEVHTVGSLLVVLHSLTGAPVAVLRDERDLSDYCAKRFGVRP
ncbi:hypothetical protein SAMN03159489_05979 [Pseudomonas sp. NFPP07]|uniref:hypothetical protein n=1 Tax=Pseudomonas sp. NFPP07 TaxID=1566213 RepID=UPI0008EDADAB|nr:hypothetical protein [Pseudomonas sp. NFPP07]SFQ82548.1 hypothetical protein SAMN03159489_05979 [Pseudomonas sp. NFPP07]